MPGYNRNSSSNRADGRSRSSSIRRSEVYYPEARRRTPPRSRNPRPQSQPQPTNPPAAQAAKKPADKNPRKRPAKKQVKAFAFVVGDILTNTSAKENLAAFEKPFKNRVDEGWDLSVKYATFDSVAC